VLLLLQKIMPRKCSIIGCRTNYRKRNDSDDNSACSVFRFPKDVGRLREWIQKIPQAGLTAEDITDNMGVCERHFDARFVVRDRVFRRPDGSKFTSPRDAPILSDDAVPTLFPNTPSYLSSVPPPKRRNPDDRRAELSEREDQQFQSWLDVDIILDYSAFVTKLSSDAVLGSNWTFVNKGNFILFVNIDVSSCPCPTVFASFTVSSDMTLTTFDSKQPRDSTELSWLLGDDSKLTRWSQLPNICAHLNNTCLPLNAVPTIDDHVTIIKDQMKQLIHASRNDQLQLDENNKLEFRLKFLLKQFELLYLAQKRYSSECLLLAFKIYCSSRPNYVSKLLI